MEKIQYTGLDNIDDGERRTLDKLSAEYYEKIQRSLQNVTSLQIHIKTYKKQGKVKYSIHAKAVAPTKIFVSTKAHDWHFPTTLHKAFKDLEMQIQHRLHTDDQRPKGVYKRSGKPMTPAFAERIGLRIKNLFKR
jgi:hypothetical protein